MIYIDHRLRIFDLEPGELFPTKAQLLVADATERALSRPKLDVDSYILQLLNREYPGFAPYSLLRTASSADITLRDKYMNKLCTITWKQWNHAMMRGEKYYAEAIFGLMRNAARYRVLRPLGA